MGHGGRRQGAGRPIGTGSPLRALAKVRASERADSKSYLRDLVGTEDDPARIALNLAKDPSVEVRLRMDCALGLMPFVHPKLSFTEVNAHHTSVHIDTPTVLRELEDRLARLSPKAPIIDANAAEPDKLSEAESVRNGGFPAFSDDRSNLVSAPSPQSAQSEVGE